MVATLVEEGHAAASLLEDGLLDFWLLLVEIGQDATLVTVANAIAKFKGIIHAIIWDRVSNIATYACFLELALLRMQSLLTQPLIVFSSSFSLALVV